VQPGGPRLAAATDATETIAASPVHSSIPGVDHATRSFANLVASRNLTVRLGLLSVAVAFVLGIFHAIAPGHGKTVMAAYLVGQRGTLRQALGVGAGVTLTHTAGVLVLGLILSVSTVAAPERLYPWLGTLSGLMLASIGIGLLLRARRLHKLGVDGIWHSHAPGGHGHVHSDWLPHAATPHAGATIVASTPAPMLVGAGAPTSKHTYDHAPHSHAPHSHDHAPREVWSPAHATGASDTEVRQVEGVGEGVAAAPGAPVMGWRWIVAMGFAGGMVPSPSALVVLLGAVALGRTWFGVALVSAYGVGMATTLVVAGLVLVRARVHIERLVVSERGRRMTRVLSVLPMITAVVIVGGGLLVAARALRAM
jgi:nickel/cobalt exporter